VQKHDCFDCMIQGSGRDAASVVGCEHCPHRIRVVQRRYRKISFGLPEVAMASRCRGLSLTTLSTIREQKHDCLDHLISYVAADVAAWTGNVAIRGSCVSVAVPRNFSGMDKALTFLCLMRGQLWCRSMIALTI
jgi:hypothetical protein